MKQLILLAVLCLLASASPVSAQLIIRNSGHAEVGVNPMVNNNDPDTVSFLKVFGQEATYGAGGHIAFGDSAFVAIGELGTTNTDRLWLHGKKGIYLTMKTDFGPIADTVLYCNPEEDNRFHFKYDLTAGTVLIQSDERFKENVEPVGEVLPSLKSLEAVSYNLRNRASRQKNDSERYGFLAQNVKEVFPELVHTDSEGYMYVDYIGLIPILVQSINELRAELAELKGQNDGEASPVMSAQQQAGQSETEAGLNAAKLYQNAPNPWSSETVIRYSLPRSVARADIYIYDLQGAQLKSIPATGRGESQVALTAHDLKAGMYLYALVADGKLIDSKQMILTK
jgi:hypothetical protein